jgi:hypothetical protein
MPANGGIAGTPITDPDFDRTRRDRWRGRASVTPAARSSPKGRAGFVAVTSFGLDENCAGAGFGYRVDTTGAATFIINSNL